MGRAHIRPGGCAVGSPHRPARRIGAPILTGRAPRRVDRLRFDLIVVLLGRGELWRESIVGSWRRGRSRAPPHAATGYRYRRGRLSVDAFDRFRGRRRRQGRPCGLSPPRWQGTGRHRLLTCPCSPRFLKYSTLTRADRARSEGSVGHACPMRHNLTHASSGSLFFPLHHKNIYSCFGLSRLSQ
jgi:hypothetical protein